MEVFETVNNTQVLVASNWTSERDPGDEIDPDLEDPVMGVWGLLPDSDYIISVKAVNERGESSPVYVGGSTRMNGGREDGATWLPINGNEADEDARRPLLFVIVGILVTLMILGALITAILAVRRRKMAKLNAIEVKSATNTTGNSSPASNPELQEALLQEEVAREDAMTPTKGPGPSNIQRKVSFREEDIIKKSKEMEDVEAATSGCQSRQVLTCPDCEFHLQQQQQMQGAASPVLQRSSNSPLMPPVQRAIVRTFSIDKMRPVCPVCNPVGDTPYPDDLPKHAKNNNRSAVSKNADCANGEHDVEEVQRLNNELDELQKCLLSGAAALAAAVEEQDKINFVANGKNNKASKRS